MKNNDIKRINKLIQEHNDCVDNEYDRFLNSAYDYDSQFWETLEIWDECFLESIKEEFGDIVLEKKGSETCEMNELDYHYKLLEEDK